MIWPLLGYKYSNFCAHAQRGTYPENISNNLKANIAIHFMLWNLPFMALAYLEKNTPNVHSLVISDQYPTRNFVNIF